MRRYLFFFLLIFTLVAQAKQAVDFDHKRISLALGEEPNLYSPRVTDSESMFVLAHIMEGLLQFGEDNALLPAVAHKWELREDGATFWLRRDARWRDGKPVIAADFVYAWQRVIKPKTAAPYASMLFPIKHAEAIAKGELDASKLGVKAVGDYQLEVSFERPCPYFLKLMPFATFLPLRQDMVEKYQPRYAAEQDVMMTNGAFYLADWIHGAALRLNKSETYWNAASIHLNGIDIPYITADAAARLNLFRNQQIAYTRINGDTYSLAVTAKQVLHTYADGFLHYLLFNQTEGKATENLNLREAIYHLIDTKVIANKVLASPAHKPIYSQFPTIVKAESSTLEALYPARRTHPNLKQARAALAKVPTATPSLSLLVSDTPSAIRLAEYLQFVIEYGLGIKVHIDKQTFKQRLAKTRGGDFDLVITNWGPDFDDGLTYADLFTSWNINNRGKHHSLEYDRWVRVMQESLDPIQRSLAMRYLRDLVQTERFMVPLYESGSIYLKHPKLKHVYRSAFGGDPNLRFVEIQP